MNLTNKELNEAIADTEARIKLCGTAQARYNILHKHFEALLAERQRRAEVRPVQVVPAWFDEPFIAEGLQALGLTQPTPREFGETLARRYRSIIADLEEKLSATAPQPEAQPQKILGYLSEHNLPHSSPFRWQFSETLGGVYRDTARRIIPVYEPAAPSARPEQADSQPTVQGSEP